MYEVYVITCAPTGLKYVGYTRKGTEVRFREHLDNCRSKPGRLALAIVKYGKEAFSFETVWSGETHTEACAEEIRLIAALGTLSPGGYNLTYGGDGVPLTAEQYETVAAKKRGKYSERQRVALERRMRGEQPPVKAHTPFGRVPILSMSRSERRFARRYAAGLVRPKSIPISDEHRDKIRQSKLGKPRSEATKAKLRAANLGKVLSQETVDKIRLSSTGRRHSEETRAKIGNAHRGVPKKRESVEKLRSALTGRTRNPELTRRQKETWQLKQMVRSLEKSYGTESLK